LESNGVWPHEAYCSGHAVNDSMAQHGTARHSMAQHGTAWHSRAQQGIAWLSIAQHDSAWLSMAQPACRYHDSCKSAPVRHSHCRSQYSMADILSTLVPCHTHLLPSTQHCTLGNIDSSYVRLTKALCCSQVSKT